ncbi:hypothetical protein NH340_JMT02219 [Sarcoptes scabiei]|nr:hypothetical protein NH340_JMT02219 [Sarcoptes scabiei]
MKLVALLLCQFLFQNFTNLIQCNFVSNNVNVDQSINDWEKGNLGRSKSVSIWRKFFNGSTKTISNIIDLIKKIKEILDGIQSIELRKSQFLNGSENFSINLKETRQERFRFVCKMVEKSFESLQQSKLFKKSSFCNEIQQGSTEKSAINLVEKIENHFNNIVSNLTNRKDSSRSMDGFTCDLCVPYCIQKGLALKSRSLDYVYNQEKKQQPQ